MAMKSKLMKPLLALVLAALAMHAQASRSWLLPSATVLDAHDWVTVSAAII